MKDASKRILLIGLAQLLAFEFLMQISVHWRESTGELWLYALMLATLVGLIWAVLPAFPKMHMRVVRISFQSLLAIFAFVAMQAVDYFHSWHLRPNLGIYREPDWVAEHVEFQEELRERIKKNMWRTPNN